MPIRAAGFILFRRDPRGWRYLLLHHPDGDGWWSPPKGHAHAGELARETARRETIEECGIDPGDGHPWFRADNDYRVARGPKRVTYFAAAVATRDVVLSEEHDEAAWLDLDGALEAVEHASLRDVIRSAATFLKDPWLRRGLEPEAAREMLVRHAGPDHPVVRHTAEVAAMARAIAEVWPGLDPGFVEACAWLHDLGRTRGPDQAGHPLRGFRLVCEEGWPGYAPTCISHWTKGRPRSSLGPEGDPGADEVFRACDLLTFETFERAVALADLMATGDRRTTIGERCDDLAARYGTSAFIDETRAIGERLRAEMEATTGRSLYATAGVPV